MSSKETRDDSHSPGEEFPAAIRLIDDIETLKVIADPYRIRIIETMGSDRLTVKQLAKRLDESVHKLYYHIRLLEKHRIIVPVESNIVSGIVEKTYAVAARRFELKDGLLSASPEGGAQFIQMTRSILDTTFESIQRAYEAGHVSIDTEEKRTVINRGMVFLDDESAEEFAKRLEKLTDEFDGDHDERKPEEKPYGLTVVFHRLAERGEANE
jgi:predicted transcriptional regulator